MIDTLKSVWDDWNEYCKERQKANDEEKKVKPKYNFSSDLHFGTIIPNTSKATNATGTSKELKSDRVFVPDVPPAVGSYSYSHGYGGTWFGTDKYGRCSSTCPVNNNGGDFNIGDPVKTPDGDGYIHAIDDQGLFLVELDAEKDVVYEFSYEEIKKDTSREPKKPKEGDGGRWTKGSTNQFIAPTRYKDGYGSGIAGTVKFIGSDGTTYPVNTGTMTVNIESKPVANTWWYGSDETIPVSAPVTNIGSPPKVEDAPTKEYVNGGYKHRPMPDKNGICQCSDCLSWATDFTI